MVRELASLEKEEEEGSGLSVDIHFCWLNPQLLSTTLDFPCIEIATD